MYEFLLGSKNVGLVMLVEGSYAEAHPPCFDRLNMTAVIENRRMTCGGSCPLFFILYLFNQE
jgi:hypothetical protein